MSYQVLARKYRPQRFEDLVGQEPVARALQNAVASGRVAHAFLFTGIRGVGKTTAARLLAKALNCEQGPRPDPCNACSNCMEISESRSLDVIEIDGASNRGIDAIRELTDNVRYSPAKGRYRIYIIDEAHMVTREGFNALLKTLEEPPAHAKFIFATTAIDKFPDTIVSRCQRYDFRRIPAARIGEQLRAIAEQEHVTITDGAVYVIAREAEGSLRDAESLLDRMIAFSGTTIDDEEVSRVLGVADRRARDAVAEAVLGADARRALEVVADVHDSGRDLERFSRDLLEHLRNLTVVKLYGTRGTLRDLPDDEIEDLRRQSETRAIADLQRMFRIALQADDELRRSTVPRMVLEMTVVRLATLEPAAPVDEVLRRLDELEQSLLAAPATARPRAGRSGGGETSRPESPRSRESVARTSAPTAEAPPIEWETAPEARPATDESDATPSPAAARAAASAPVESGRWDEFLDFVRGKRITTYFTLSHARVLEHANGSLRLAVGRESWAKELRSLVPALEEYAAEFFGGRTQVGIETVEPSAPAPAPRSPTIQALENPAVQKAVDILGGQVREVRELRRRPRGE